MSYVIHLFEHLGMATLAEAAQVHARLSATLGGSNERMLRWASAMQARFPAHHAGWLEGPPNGNTDGRAVLSVGLTTAGLDELLPAAVSLALPLGLCLLDEQAGRCYLPGGWALTQRGRFALKPRAEGAAPPAAPSAPLLEAGSWQWAMQKLSQRVGPRLAAHGFQASPRANVLRFARVVPMGFQSLSLLLRDGLRIEPSVALEPVLPHALYRAVRPGRSLSCHTHNVEGLQRFGAQPETRPGRASYYRLACGVADIDALGDAIAQWTLDNFLPLFDACRDLPGILRCDSQRHQTGLPAFVAANRTTLALRHWVEGQDLGARAEDLAAEIGVQAEIPLRSAAALRALPSWAGTWRPLSAPCQPYQFHEAVTAPALAQAALPRLRRAAESRGFQLAEEGPLSLRLRRESSEVLQTLCVDVKPASTAGAELKLTVRWEAPALTAHWRSAWPGAAAAGDLGTWQSGSPPSYVWMRGPLEAAGLDNGDFSAHIQWPDQIADHVRYTEQSLLQCSERLLDPAMSWQGLAKQLPTVDEFSAWQKTHWMSSSLTQLQPGGWAALLMLSSLYRADGLAYAAAMRAAAVYVREVEPLLLCVEQASA